MADFRRRFVLSLAVAALLVVSVGCSEIGIDLDTPPPPSGIRGLVLLGPTCPVESSPGANDPVPCVTPYAANLVVLDAENVKVASVSSGDDGHFSVDVPPGEYLVAPETGSDAYPIANPVPVTVIAGQYTEIQINYDTGIR